LTAPNEWDSPNPSVCAAQRGVPVNLRDIRGSNGVP
jgi:hypothetical protein